MHDLQGKEGGQILLPYQWLHYFRPNMQSGKILVYVMLTHESAIKHVHV